MGGTSTDVCHYAGAYERSFESVVAGARVRAPMMLIHTVAAGGGSILHYDGARFRVGPDSAGADPGPLCLSPRRPAHRHRRQCHDRQARARILPAPLRPRARPAARREAVREAFAALAETLGDARAPEEVADGFIRIAVENMANAIKTISVQRGHDVTEYVLNAFGGAAGQHACLVADALGISSVLIHPLSGVLSAYGMGLASLSATRTKAVLELLDEDGLGARARDPRAAGRRRDGRSSSAQGSQRDAITVQRAAASALCRHRQRPAHPARRAYAGMRAAVRDRSPATLRLRQPRARTSRSRRSRSKHAGGGEPARRA